MKCSEMEEHLSAYLGEEIAPDLRRSIKGHLKGCKKCRARLEALKTEKGVQKKEKEIAVPPEEAASPPDEKPPSPPSTDEIRASVWRRPVKIAATLLLIGGTIYLYHRGTSDLKADFSVAENATSPVAEALTSSSAPVESDGGEPGKGTPAPPLQAEPADPPVPLPMKAHEVATQSLSKGARRQATASRPPAIKLLLISRDIKEAADTVAAQAMESQGKVLSKKRDEMEAKVVLLIPAGRYEVFSQSLQSLGLVKDISKKQPPTEGSLKIEVTIE